MWKPRLSAVHGASLLVYGVLLLFALLEQFGQTSNDTKTPLIERPLDLLQSAGTLWNPQMNFGELQNQAYGYLFPQGPFFVVLDTLHLAPWVTERLWSVLVLVVGCEGARLVARAIGLDVWPAWLAGMAFGLNARVNSQVGCAAPGCSPPHSTRRSRRRCWRCPAPAGAHGPRKRSATEPRCADLNPSRHLHFRR